MAGPARQLEGGTLIVLCTVDCRPCVMRRSLPSRFACLAHHSPPRIPYIHEGVLTISTPLSSQGSANHRPARTDALRRMHLDGEAEKLASYSIWTARTKCVVYCSLTISKQSPQRASALQEYVVVQCVASTCIVDSAY